MIAVFKAVRRPAKALYRRRCWWKFWQPKVLVHGSILLGFIRSDLVGLYHTQAEACAAMERLEMSGGNREVWFEDVGEAATGHGIPGPDPVATLKPPLTMRAATDRLDHAENRPWPKVPTNA